MQAAHVGLGSDLSVGDAKRFAEAAIWVGLLSDVAPMPQKSTRLDSFVALLIAKPEMSYVGAERDMCLMHHEVDVEFPATGLKQRHTATLIQYTENGVTSMSKTVGLTAAIGAQVVSRTPCSCSCAHSLCLWCHMLQLILDGRTTSKGMVCPVTPEWYEPMLEVLHAEDVKFLETTRTL